MPPSFAAGLRIGSSFIANETERLRVKFKQRLRRDHRACRSRIAEGWFSRDGSNRRAGNGIRLSGGGRYAARRRRRLAGTGEELSLPESQGGRDRPALSRLRRAAGKRRFFAEWRPRLS